MEARTLVYLHILHRSYLIPSLVPSPRKKTYPRFCVRHKFAFHLYHFIMSKKLYSYFSHFNHKKALCNIISWDLLFLSKIIAKINPFGCM